MERKGGARFTRVRPLNTAIDERLHERVSLRKVPAYAVHPIVSAEASSSSCVCLGTGCDLFVSTCRSCATTTSTAARPVLFILTRSLRLRYSQGPERNSYQPDSHPEKRLRLAPAIGHSRGGDLRF